MLFRPFGSTGRHVSSIGIGTAPLCCGNRPETADAVAVLCQMMDAGVTLFDTADTYCRDGSELHYGERLLADARNHVGNRAEHAIVATKGGTRRTARKGWEIDGNPEYLYRQIIGSYAALGGQRPIPLWQHHWPDPRYSIRDTMHVVRRAIDEKLIRAVGVSNYSLEQLIQARAEINIESIQVQYNFWHREPEETGLVEYCENHQIALLTWRPFGGPGLAERLHEIPQLQKVSRARNVSPQRVVISWLIAKSSCIIPIPGTKSAKHFLDCLAALDMRLDPAEIAALDRIGMDELLTRERPAEWLDAPPLSDSIS